MITVRAADDAMLHAADNLQSLLELVTWVGSAAGVVAIFVGGAVAARAHTTGFGSVSRGVTLVAAGLFMAVGPAFLRFVLGELEAPTADRPQPDSPPVSTPAPVPTDTEPTGRIDIPWEIIGLVLLALAVLAAAGAGVAVLRRKRLDRLAAAKQNAVDHAAALAQYNDVASAYAAHVTDPHSFFERPLLDDIRDPRTAAFVEAFDAATYLRTDTVPTDPRRIREFAAAAALAHRTWRAAYEHATAVGFTDPVFDTRTVERITASLTVARDDGATADERRAALDAVARLTAGAQPVPDRVTAGLRAAIESAARRELTTGGATL